jgi:hypothetical protein
MQGFSRADKRVIGRNGSWEEGAVQGAGGDLWAGFDSEFSERDNVLIIGNVLGLSKQEVRQQLDEISRFSELKAFIGEPVKTYHLTDVHAPWVLGRYPS